MDLTVYCEIGYCYHNSKVYAIDSVRDRFLVVDDLGYFHWVNTEDCQLVKED